MKPRRKGHGGDAKCLVCGQKSSPNGHMFSFPSNPRQRELFCQSMNMGVSEIPPFMKKPGICSRHFENKMLQTFPNRICIKPYGLPTKYPRLHVEEVEIDQFLSRDYKDSLTKTQDLTSSASKRKLYHRVFN